MWPKFTGQDERRKLPTECPGDVLVLSLTQLRMQQKLMGAYIKGHCPKPKKELHERTGDPAQRLGENGGPN